VQSSAPFQDRLPAWLDEATAARVVLRPLSTPRHAAPSRCAARASPHARSGARCFRLVDACGELHHAAVLVQVASEETERRTEIRLPPLNSLLVS